MRNQLLGAILLSVPAAPALAQTAPPLDVVMELDLATGENRIRSILVDRNGERRAYAPDTWVRPVVAGYAQAKAAIFVALGEPAPPGLNVPRKGVLREGLPSAPLPSEARAGLIVDDLANSMLLNIADDVAGLTLRFEGEGLMNAPGPDLVILEASIPAGDVSGGCPGVPAPGADAMVAALPSGARAVIAPESFIDFGPAGAQLNHGAASLGEAEVRIASIAELESAELVPLAAIDYFKVYATAFDLSELGVAPGATIARLSLSSTGEVVQTDDGPRLCWTADPILVVGLP